MLRRRLLVGIVAAHATLAGLACAARTSQADAPPPASMDLGALEHQMTDLVERGQSGIVVVSGDRTDVRASDLGNAAQPATRRLQVGTGIILDANGHVVTTASVVRAARSFRVTWNGSDFTATLVTVDAVSRLALLYAEGLKGAHPLPLADSAEVRVGSWVVAIGAGPAGRVQSSFGTVTRAPSSDDDLETHVLATTATLGPGATGAALLNTRGEIVGIASAAIMVRTTGERDEGAAAIGAPSSERTVVTSGGSIAIPVDVVAEVADIVRARGTINRSYLGVRWNPDEAEGVSSTEMAGAPVWEVMAGSPAERAGIVKGDVVTHFNGQAVTSGPLLRRLVHTAAPSEVVRLTVVRGRQPLTFAVPLDTLRAGPSDQSR